MIIGANQTRKKVVPVSIPVPISQTLVAIQIGLIEITPRRDGDTNCILGDY